MPKINRDTTLPNRISVEQFAWAPSRTRRTMTILYCVSFNSFHFDDAGQLPTVNKITFEASTNARKPRNKNWVLVEPNNGKSKVLCLFRTTLRYLCLYSTALQKFQRMGSFFSSLFGSNEGKQPVCKCDRTRFPTSDCLMRKAEHSN